MRSRKTSPSEKAVSSVTSFVAGRHLYGKPRPSTLELMVESRKLSRLIKQVSHGFGQDGKPSRQPGAVASFFIDAWDMFMAVVVTILLAALRLVIFFVVAGLMIMAIPTIIRHL